MQNVKLQDQMDFLGKGGVDTTVVCGPAASSGHPSFPREEERDLVCDDAPEKTTHGEPHISS